MPVVRLCVLYQNPIRESLIRHSCVHRYVDGRDAYFRKYLFILLCIEMQQGFADRKTFAVVHGDRVCYQCVRERL